MKALMDEGIVPPIKTGRGGGSKKKTSNETSVGKRGSIIIPKDVVEEMGFVQDNRFLIKKTKTGIMLKRLY
jgi:bifunctional DNA-binding transcriptional regulator/antitoxin component of YhaV-PrlF toxin-antitoxin module